MHFLYSGYFCEETLHGTFRMVLFTVLQAFGLALLWVVKSFKQIALAFPFFVILMIPYRSLLKFIFTEIELSAVISLAA